MQNLPFEALRGRRLGSIAALHTEDVIGRRHMVRMTTMMAATLAGALLMGTAHAQQTPSAASAPAMSDTTKAKPSERAAARKTMAEKRAEKRAATKAEPTAWDKTKDMTRKQWSSAKGAWTKEKDKWRGCNAKAKAEKLSGTKRWTAIGSCMTS